VNPLEGKVRPYKHNMYSGSQIFGIFMGFIVTQWLKILETCKFKKSFFGLFGCITGQAYACSVGKATKSGFNEKRTFLTLFSVKNKFYSKQNFWWLWEYRKPKRPLYFPPLGDLAYIADSYLFLCAWHTSITPDLFPSCEVHFAQHVEGFRQAWCVSHFVHNLWK